MKASGRSSGKPEAAWDEVALAGQCSTLHVAARNERAFRPNRKFLLRMPE